MQMTRDQNTHLRSPSSFFIDLHHIQATSCCPVSLCQLRRTLRAFLGASSDLDSRRLYSRLGQLLWSYPVALQYFNVH